jgi:pantoate--beta-alanine ligase
MSSRNAYLTPDQRAVAATLRRVLMDCARRILKKDKIARVLDDGSADIESTGFVLDYLEARHAHTLAKVETLKDGPLRLLVAARLGTTRLIDNVPV